MIGGENVCMHDWPTNTPKVPSPMLVAAWLVLDTLPIERVPIWAAHWIADGRDGESLRRLAGLSSNDSREVRDLLDAALRECGVDDRDISPEVSTKKAAAMEAFTAVAQLQASGRASERWVVSKVYEIVEPDFDPELVGLPLGRLFDLDDEWSAGRGRPDDELRSEVRGACRDQLTAAYGMSGLDPGLP